MGHESAAAHVAHHRRRRTPDIDVKILITKLFVQHLYRVHELLRTVAHQLRNERQGSVVGGCDVLPHFRTELAGGLCRKERGHKAVYAAKVTVYGVSERV